MTTRLGPPAGYEALILAVSVKPFGSGIFTCKSRGTEITLIVSELPLIRTSMIVSEFAALWGSPARWSEPRIRIVCGAPGWGIKTGGCMIGGDWLMSLRRLTNCSKPATAVAAAVHVTTRTPASANRHSAPPRECGKRSLLMPARPRSPARPESALVAWLGCVHVSKPHRCSAHEVGQRATVPSQRRDRYPLLGAVVTRAGWAEFDGQDPGLDERGGVRRSVAPDAHHLAP